jgi:amino acid transporter
LFGKGAGVTFAIIICLVIMGAMNSNIFVVGRLTVAAANKKYIPAVFGYIGKILPGSSPDDSQAAGELKFNAPFNALILNVILTSLYILLGNFRALLTFIGLAQCKKIHVFAHVWNIELMITRYILLHHRVWRCDSALSGTGAQEAFQASYCGSGAVQHRGRLRCH